MNKKNFSFKSEKIFVYLPSKKKKLLGREKIPKTETKWPVLALSLPNKVMPVRARSIFSSF